MSLAGADLPGAQLAQYADGTITLDVNAGGHGWFVVGAPTDDHEVSGASRVLLADEQGAAANRIDLLSVLAHELGHVMGLGHGDGGVMDGQLQPGQRAPPAVWARMPVKAVSTAPVRALTDVAAGAPGFAIDRGARVVVPAPAGDASMASVTFGLPTFAPVTGARQQRFINELGARNERLKPNAGLRPHLPVASESAPRVSKL